MRSAVVASLLAALCSALGVARAAEVGEAAAQERARLEAEIAEALGVKPGGDAARAPAAAPSGSESIAPSIAPAAGLSGVAGAAGGSPAAGALARVLLLPDLSAVGSFAVVHDSYDAGALSPRSGSTGPSRKPTFLFQELELALQAVVDPYARADVFVSFTPDGVSVEEAYLTTLGLPASLQLRAGRFFSPLGRLNVTHPHSWDFLDAPLAHDRLVGNEKLGGPGLDLAWLAPLAWFAELHLAGQSTAPYPGETERLTGTVRLAQFLPLTEAATLGLGLSAARRDEGAGAFRDLGSLDLYLKLRPPAGRAYLTLQGELFARRFRHQAAVAQLDGGDGWGAYAQLFWRQDPWWGYGVRWDRAPAGPAPGRSSFAPGAEQRWSAVADWFLTEFQRVGLQGSYDRRPFDRSGWEWILHLEFVMGAHGAHPF